MGLFASSPPMLMNQCWSNRAKRLSSASWKHFRRRDAVKLTARLQNTLTCYRMILGTRGGACEPVSALPPKADMCSALVHVHFVQHRGQIRSSRAALPGGRHTAKYVVSLHVRFTPESRHVRCKSKCPLCAKSGHSAVSKPDRKTCRRSTIYAYYGVSPYMAFSWPWANARAGGISILPPMISM